MMWSFSVGEDKYRGTSCQTETHPNASSNSNAQRESIPRKWHQADDGQQETKEGK